MSALLNIKAGVQALNRALQSSRSLHSSGERITAGVSYVVSSKLALPHVTIRPALPEAAAGPTVESLVNVLRDQAAIALVMPAHNEGVIKEYLRHPERRWTVADSNVQIGLLVRKGIGGTSPARAAARRLYREGVLGRILGDSESHSQLAGYMPPASNSPVQIQQGDQPASAGRGPGSCDSGNALAVAAITETRDAEADELLETTSDIGQEAAEGQLEAEAVSVHSAEQVVPASSEPRVRLYTQSCRLEMYCAQQTWTALSREQQAALIGAIQGLEKHLSRMFARDSFTYHLHAESNQVQFNGRSCVKTEYFFQSDHIPNNYHEVVDRRQQALPDEAHQPARLPASAESTEACEADNGAPKPASVPPNCPQVSPATLLPAGICTYANFYTPEELRCMEASADGVHAKAREGRLPQTCFHETRGRGGGLKRTKFFFGARYLWTAEQAADPASRQAGGVRLDVPHAPTWMQAFAEKPLVETGLVQKGFFDAWALNMYHDGSEGIQSHFDDGTRFARPIFSVRLFSDSRLSFGTQLYGYTNGAFTVDMPRGCITVMEAGGYAVEGVKHCVRPADLAGKSAALIMRHINPACMEQARDLFDAQTLQMLRGWSMKDAPIPPVPCWAASRCIQRLESPVWLPGSGPESQVAHVLDAIISKVERQNYLEQLANGHIRAATHSQAGSIGVKRKVPLARMGALRRLPTAPSQLDSFGDAYAPPQTAAKPGASDGSALSLTGPPSVLPQLAAQASMTAAKVAAQLKGHPGAVCAACERPLSAGQHVWACLGQCCQIFHSACAAPMGAMKCAQCMSDRRMCFHCKAPGPPGELVKCSMGRCGHFYHRTCAAACPLTKWGSSSGSFRCPAHYCARCGLSGPMRSSLLQASPFSTAGRPGSCKQSFQAPKSVAKQLLHCRKWSLRPHAPKAAESVASTVIDEQSLNERRSSAAQAASTPDSTHHKEVRGATETARATFNIVFVTAEVAPWSKTGGLGDVCGSLPPALAARGHRVMVVSPRYANYDVVPDSKGPGMKVSVLDTEVGLYHHRSKGVDWVFVDHPSYPRPGGLYADAFGVYGDNQYRYTLLCLAGLEAPLQLQIDGRTYGDDCIFIANDWHAAMVPVYLAAKYRPGGVYGTARSVLAIHNLRHQGVFPPKTFATYALPGHWYGVLEWQYPPHQRQGSYEEEGRAVNTMKGGISTADRIVTVSPGYAWEIQTPEGGWGMEQMLGSRAYALNGVLNGIDNHDWNPQHDKHLAKKYSVSNFSRGKAANKAALQKELSLPERPEVPLIGFIGRLDYQKGADLVLGVVPWLMEQDVQLVCLGTGDVSLEAGMRWMENTYPDRARGWVGFNVPMSHKITAAADILLMPSRFEPCGLNQLYAMAYGTVPVAHATGGLRDTVIPFNPWDGTGTGWTFSPCTTEAFTGALRNTLETFREHPDSFRALQQRGMERNSTWDKAAAEYETIFGWAKIDQPYCK
ncbi:hypothetical protein WJX75_005380 [Coccomyxa subellipsoidea]|uniref:starch synthase n=1 Tax=Coccomyxa subellipsoidea TaxID=248742 RepID=A0ABR2YF35_9CHLO